MVSTARRSSTGITLPSAFEMPWDNDVGLLSPLMIPTRRYHPPLCRTLKLMLALPFLTRFDDPALDHPDMTEVAMLK